jgi:hypothetical protein
VATLPNSGKGDGGGTAAMAVDIVYSRARSSGTVVIIRVKQVSQ